MKDSMPPVGTEYIGYRLFKGSHIPDWVDRASDLSSSSKRVFGRLLRYQGKDGRCFPSHRTLGRDLRLSDRQVRNCLKQLEKQGYIARIPPSAHERGQHKSTSYKTLWHRNIRPEDLRQATEVAFPRATEAPFPRSGEEECRRAGEVECQREGKDASAEENDLRETSRRDTTNSHDWQGLLDANRSGSPARSAACCDSVVLEKEKQARYIQLKVAKMEREGKVASTPLALKVFLEKKARAGELDLSDYEQLVAEETARKAKTERQAEKERQEFQLREDMTAIEAERIREGLSCRELCQRVFEQKKNVAGVGSEAASLALLRLYPKEAQAAKWEAFRVIGKRNLRSRKKLNAEG